MSCSAPIPRSGCENRIRELLSPFGEVGGVLIAFRASDQDPLVAAVEMRGGQDDAVEGLSDTEINGHKLRIRRASALDVQQLTH